MGQISDTRREDVWFNLSLVFSNDIEYVRYNELTDIDIEQLEGIYFDEVVLYWGPLYMSVTPPTGEGFDRKEVITDIWAKLERGKKSIIARLMQKSLSTYWRCFHRETWEMFVVELKKYRQARE